jgi:Xaa-Pro aminopeptidase
MAEESGIGAAEFAARRERVLAALGRSVGVVFAGEGSAPLRGAWEANRHFLYLTGIHDEPGAAVLLDPGAETAERRAVLFLRPLNPEADRWEKVRGEISADLKRRTGFGAVMRTTMLPRMLTEAARRAAGRGGRLACLHPLAVYDAPVGPDLAVFRKVAERVPGAAVEDRTQVLARLRAVKSAAELRLMRRAVEATAAGFVAAARAIRPGVRESAVQGAMERAWRAAGARGAAYNPIVGSGLSGTILHYMSNEGVARAGELMVIDAGAEFGAPGAAYAADVTRTFPVSGHFTTEQREVYEVVLAALRAGFRAARPGARMLRDVDAAARGVIERAGFGDAFIHGIGHPLGLEVHDPPVDGALKAGMVVTVEPGIYLPERRMGVRIEDDVLITRRGSENLTAMIPRTAREVEAAMGSAGGRAPGARRRPRRRTNQRARSRSSRPAA